LGFGSGFFGLGSVRFFWFQAYKIETEPNRLVFLNFNRFNRVFSRFGFFSYFFLFSQFNQFFNFFITPVHYRFTNNKLVGPTAMRLSIEKDILINDINPIIPLLRPLTTTNNDGPLKNKYFFFTK
jgi:hypothetical protein